MGAERMGLRLHSACTSLKRATGGGGAPAHAHAASLQPRSPESASLTSVDPVKANLLDQGHCALKLLLRLACVVGGAVQGKARQGRREARTRGGAWRGPMALVLTAGGWRRRARAAWSAASLARSPPTCHAPPCHLPQPKQQALAACVTPRPAPLPQAPSSPVALP